MYTCKKEGGKFQLITGVRELILYMYTYYRASKM